MEEMYKLNRGGRWNFDEQVKTFESHVRSSIPGYERAHQIILYLSRFFISPGSQIYDLGSSTGELLLKLAAYNRETQETHYTGIDKSTRMVDQAYLNKIKFDDALPVEFKCSPLTDFEFKPSDLIISAFTLQFLDIEARAALLEKIRESLKPGKAFLLFEKTLSQTVRNQEIISTVHKRWKLDYGSTPQEILEKEFSVSGQMFLKRKYEIEHELHQARFADAENVFTDLCFSGWLVTG